MLRKSLSKSPAKSNPAEKKHVPEVLPEVRAKCFVLVDDNGCPRARLQVTRSDNASLAFYDKNGLRMALRAGSDEASLSIYSYVEDASLDKVDRVFIGFEYETESCIAQPRISITDDHGAETLRLTASGMETFLSEEKPTDEPLPELKIEASVNTILNSRDEEAAKAFFFLMCEIYQQDDVSKIHNEICLPAMQYSFLRTRKYSETLTQYMGEAEDLTGNNNR